MNFQLVPKSSNAKVGPIPVSNSHRATCPDACPLKGGACYAEAGFHTRLNWDKLDRGERGTDWAGFLAAVRQIKPGQLWRHNVSGDLPGANDRLDPHALRELAEASSHAKGFTYTHYPMTRSNTAAVRRAAALGFTVNASANTVQEAVTLSKRLPGVPVVTMVPRSAHGDTWRRIDQDGVRVVQCPAEYRDDVTCASCGLCARNDRTIIVGFTTHGPREKSADVIARG